MIKTHRTTFSVNVPTNSLRTTIKAKYYSVSLKQLICSINYKQIFYKNYIKICIQIYQRYLSLNKNK